MALFWRLALHGWSFFIGVGFFFGVILCLSYVTVACKHAISGPETTTKREVAKISADPQKGAAWDQRPANALRREWSRFLKGKPPPNLSFSIAKAFSQNRGNVDKSLWWQWRLYEALYEKINEAYFREASGIKTVSQAYRAAIEELTKTGQQLEPLEPDRVVEKILEMRPELRKAKAES